MNGNIKDELVLSGRGWEGSSGTSLCKGPVAEGVERWPVWLESRQQDSLERSEPG